MKKRGISPLISTILIISFVIILAVITLTWGMDFIRSNKEKTQLESEVALKCSSADFKIANVCVFSDNVNVVLENTGSEDISGFLYRVLSEKGTAVDEATVDLSRFSKQTFIDEFNFDVNAVGTPNEINIFPEVNVEGTNFVCSVLREKELENCFSILNLVTAQGFVNSASNEGQSLPDVERDLPPFFSLGETEDLVEFMQEQGLTLISQIPLSDYFFGSVYIGGGTEGSLSDTYVLSNEFQIPTDDRVHFINLYGEGLGDFTYTLVDTSSSEELEIYSHCSNLDFEQCFGAPQTFEHRISIDSWKGMNVKLKLNYNIDKASYIFLYRVCYSKNLEDGCTS